MAQVWSHIDREYGAVLGYGEEARIDYGHIEAMSVELLQKLTGTKAKAGAAAQNEY